MPQQWMENEWIAQVPLHEEETEVYHSLEQQKLHPQPRRFPAQQKLHFRPQRFWHSSEEIFFLFLTLLGVIFLILLLPLRGFFFIEAITNTIIATIALLLVLFFSIVFLNCWLIGVVDNIGNSNTSIASKRKHK